MGYRIEVSPRAFKDISKLPTAIQERLKPRIDGLASDPRPAGAKKMKGEGDLWRLRVGDYRVVYEIRDQALIVAVVRLGHRRDVYRAR